MRSFSWIGIALLGLALTIPRAAAQDLTWRSFEDALARADTTGKPVLVDVWAPWCGWCHKMKQTVYPALRTQLTDRFVLARLNRDDSDTMHRYRGRRLSSRQLAKRLGAEGVPTVVLLSPGGRPLTRVSGFVTAADLRPLLSHVGTGTPPSPGRSP